MLTLKYVTNASFMAVISPHFFFFHPKIKKMTEQLKNCAEVYQRLG